jgi:uncharacterized OB-fold protein
MNYEIEALKPLPNRDSDWSRDSNLYKPFWEATRQGVLMVQECQKTRKKVWPPRFLSPFAPGTELKWVPVPTKGFVYTFNVVYRSFYPYFNDKVPYALVVVDLGDGVRMLGNTVGMDLTQIQIGMRMEAVFEKVNEQITLVQWKPEDGWERNGA